MVLFSVSVVLWPVCIVCFVCRLDSGSPNAPVYFEIVAEVPPAAESCLSLEHVNPILQMLYHFPLSTASFYNVTMGCLPTVTAMLFLYLAPLLAWGCKMIRCWIRKFLALLSSTSTHCGKILLKYRLQVLMVMLD